MRVEMNGLAGAGLWTIPAAAGQDVMEQPRASGRLTLSDDQFCLAFRIALVGDNPFNLQQPFADMCQSIIASTGRRCGHPLDRKLQHTTEGGCIQDRYPMHNHSQSSHRRHQAQEIEQRAQYMSTSYA